MRAAMAAGALAAGCQSAPDLPRFGTAVSAEQVIARVQAQRAAVRTMDGAARVRTEAPPPAKSGSFDAELVLERPYRFRQIGYDPFGSVLFDLKLDGQQLTVFNPAENLVIRHELGSGAAVPESLTAVERFFARTSIAQLLLGPGRFDDEEEWRELERDDTAITFGLFRGARQSGTIIVENDVLLLREHRVAPATPDDPDLSVRFADWREVTTPGGRVWWPHAIEVESRREKFYMAFWFDAVHINEPLKGDAFDQAIPADAKER